MTPHTDTPEGSGAWGGRRGTPTSGSAPAAASAYTPRINSLSLGGNLFIKRERERDFRPLLLTKRLFFFFLDDWKFDSVIQGRDPPRPRFHACINTTRRRTRRESRQEYSNDIRPGRKECVSPEEQVEYLAGRLRDDPKGGELNKSTPCHKRERATSQVDRLKSRSGCFGSLAVFLLRFRISIHRPLDTHNNKV